MSVTNDLRYYSASMFWVSGTYFRLLGPDLQSREQTILGLYLVNIEKKIFNYIG